MTEQFTALTESEVQAEQARHQPRDYGSEHRCVECQQDWPCPTVLLIAERERLAKKATFALTYRQDDSLANSLLRELAALAETGEKDD